MLNISNKNVLCTFQKSVVIFINKTSKSKCRLHLPELQLAMVSFAGDHQVACCVVNFRITGERPKQIFVLQLLPHCFALLIARANCQLFRFATYFNIFYYKNYLIFFYLCFNLGLLQSIKKYINC